MRDSKPAYIPHVSPLTIACKPAYNTSLSISLIYLSIYLSNKYNLLA